jgi:chromate transporter
MINPLLYFLLFFKASLFSTGGFSNLPSLHQDLVAQRWATDTQFGNAIVIGQISPGPNGLWVISLGYFSYGYLGAALALLAISLPPVLVLGVSALHAQIEHQPWMDGLMRGVSLAVIGILFTVCWTILHQPGVDWRGWPIALAAFALARTKRVPLIIILGLAGITGYVLYG